MGFRQTDAIAECQEGAVAVVYRGEQQASGIFVHKAYTHSAQEPLPQTDQPHALSDTYALYLFSTGDHKARDLPNNAGTFRDIRCIS